MGQNADNDKADETVPECQPLRRSGRRVSKPSRLSPDPVPLRPRSRNKSTTPAKNMSEPRRNPKRKASEPTKITADLHSDLLHEALRPLDAKEIEDWEGWIELESEPVSSAVVVYFSRRSDAREQGTDCILGVFQYYSTRPRGQECQSARVIHH